MTTQGFFPWSRSVPYEWSWWFAWYPVRTIYGQLAWLRYVMVHAYGEVVPSGEPNEGDLYGVYEFR